MYLRRTINSEEILGVGHNNLTSFLALEKLTSYIVGYKV